MPIFRCSKKETFIDETIEFVFTNFRDNLDSIKIILPGGYVCSQMQKTIIQRFGTTILPVIIPVGDITPEKEETFKIPSEHTGRVTALEEKIILAEIISSYNKLNYGLTQSLRLAPSLAKLFFELEANNISFNVLKNTPPIEQPEHWHFIYDFLEFAYQNLMHKTSKIGKLPPCQHQRIMFDSEVNRLVNRNNYTIIAGVIGNNIMTREFIGEIASLENGYLILPPIPAEHTASLSKQSTETLNPEEPLYNLGKLVQQFDMDIRGARCLGQPRSTILDRLLVKSSSESFDGSVEYAEFTHISQEAEYVAIKCKELLEENAHARIAILITQDQTKSQYTTKLAKHGVLYSDLLGENILQLLPTTLILEVARNICQKFSLQDFTGLILHPLIISDETRKLKKLIVKYNPFAQNIQDILAIIRSNFTEPSWLKKLTNFCKILEACNKSRRFSSLLISTIKTTEALCPDIWSMPHGDRLAEVLLEIINTNWHVKIKEPKSFPQVLKELLAGGCVYNSGGNHNIILCSANEVTLINYDLIIYTNFVENAYPLPPINSPWLNSHMIRQIGLDSWPARFGNMMYDFYLNMHNKKVIITRSVKSGGSLNSLPSPFIFRLKHILGNKLGQRSIDQPHGDSVFANEEYVYSQRFPAQISATDIETLVRAPYNFYAKKILNLKAAIDLEEQPRLSEFGNFLHRTIELYTKNYNANQGQISLGNYAKNLLEASIFPQTVRNFWQHKIEAIEKDFIHFDNERRANAKKIFSETRGELVLAIAGRKIKIVAVADRIELNRRNRAAILDYKTGVLPTKKDVMAGLSPQLMIEAIILLEGGFVEAGGRLQAENLIYVKINSRAPYISTTEITITREDILKHKQDLENLLAHYINTGQYFIEPNSMDYDDYWHLARRS